MTNRWLPRPERTLPTPRKPIADVYDAAYSGVPNWDIGRPQQAFVHLQEAGRIESPVLDVGCGTGELALYLASHGHRVLGIDLASNAIRQAKLKARWRRIPAQFLVWDAVDLGRLAEAGLSVRTVVDSAMFHILGDTERGRFVHGLESVIEPGGLYCLLGDARRDPRDSYGITPRELRDRFADGWTVEFVYETIFERRYSANPAYLAGIRRPIDS
ncbi:class I SAM-dependent methyltransferase [Salinibaculum salinum]|uniref:class I SAM-dependent methyltransferase n=1 Tax=Salinibaculum salinum TaxID=3131996 RepID=UPI0030EE3E14